MDTDIHNQGAKVQDALGDVLIIFLEVHNERFLNEIEALHTKPEFV